MIQIHLRLSYARAVKRACAGAKLAKRSSAISFVLCVFVLSAQAQRDRGELRLAVTDPSGAGLSAASELVSQANQFERIFRTTPDGHYILRDLPFGLYRLTLTHQGFAPFVKLIEIRSAVPVQISAMLAVAPAAQQVVVRDSETLIDPDATNTVRSIGATAIEEQLSAQPGREIADLVDSEPGWLYEANGILHPRGSEYGVQYVVDGLPITENRSPAFAPSFQANDAESVRVLTAGYPAEYGRKLGGVVEITTPKNQPSGLHGEADLEGGSFGTATGEAKVSYAAAADRLSIGGSGFHTDRYLDPPVLANYTNSSTANGVWASYEHDFSGRSRLRLTVNHNRVRFLAPNQLAQQEAGQRQELSNGETDGNVYYQYVISPNLLLSAAGSVRDASFRLASNPFSTPVVIDQQRGYREGYTRVDLAGHHGRNNWKVGADAIFTPAHEALQYQITDPSQFDPGTQPIFQLSDRQWDRETAAYAQDQIHLGPWNVSAGLRFDHYGFVVSEYAWSPRVGISRYIQSSGLLVHASYDRVFQTPAMENLLLASSPQLNSVASVVVRLPVRPERANYYEIGAAKALFGALRVDLNVFRRDSHNFSDDDTLLNTGVSFPIAFFRGRISGEEVRIAIPHWRRVSGFVSYSNQSGKGWGPITGGLFLGSEASSGLSDTSKFAISSDQRNTLRARVRFQASRRFWLALSEEYGSGMPVELEDTVDYASLLDQYGPAILNQVDFATGRVLPNSSLDVAGGIEVYRKEQRQASVQVEVSNLMDRVNVINFASLLSGTAVAPPRSVGARLRLKF